MSLEEMKHIFLEIKNKGNKDGLTYEDYLVLRNIRDNIMSIEGSRETHDYLNNEFFSSIHDIYSLGMRGELSYNDYISFKDNMSKLEPKIISYFVGEELFGPSQELLGDISDVIDEVFIKGLLHKFSQKDCNYISQNGFLLPLVLANNTHPKIRLTGDNRYMFLCQLHLEKTPSLGVNDLKNYYFCYGCGGSGNAVSYLMEYENLSFPESIQLLAQIYLFDVKRQEQKFAPLVQKYQDAILSDEYQNLLEIGFDRFKKREIKNFNGDDVEQLYKNRYNTINRIKNHLMDPNFTYEGPKKLIYLKARDN